MTNPSLSALPRKRNLAWLWPFAGGLSLLLLWSGIIVIGEVRPFIAPAPWDVAVEIWKNRLLLVQNFWPTLLEAVAGFICGNLAAISVAVVFVHFQRVQKMYLPIAVLFNTIPVIALAPILILIFGINVTPKIIIASLVCFFPTLVNMIRGLEAYTRSEMELMRLMSASKLEIFLRLRLPRSLPYLFSALRISCTSCVIGAIVGEWIGSTMGIGSLIIQATFNYRSGLLYAAICMSSALALSLFAAVIASEKKFLRW